MSGIQLSSKRMLDDLSWVEKYPAGERLLDDQIKV